MLSVFLFLSSSRQQILIKNVMQRLIWKILLLIRLITSNFITHYQCYYMYLQETDIDITCRDFLLRFFFVLETIVWYGRMILEQRIGCDVMG